jgi:hypothetical protein
MNLVYIEMQDSIDEFNKDRNLYGSTLDENEIEQVNSVRLIKREVIDMADLCDKMSGIILSNDKHIDEAGETIKDIKNMLQGKELTPERD